MLHTTITRAAAKNKAIDFRDRLTLANQNDYAMMHGSGGKNYNVKSTVKCVICDYSNGTGEKSVTVSANLEIETMHQIFDVVKDRISKMDYPKIDIQDISDIVKDLQQLYKNTKEGVDKNELARIGKNTAKYRDKLTALSARAGLYDYTYSQERVNVYQKNKDRIAPVSLLVINRQGVKKDGQTSKYPWYIKITNGIAPVRDMANGTTSYDGSKLKVEKEAFIILSDADMYRMMYRVMRYVEVWENTMCIPLIKNGLRIKEEERIEAQNNRT